MLLKDNEYYDYQDVFIIPQYSEVLTRREVDTSVRLGDLKINVPIVSANMDTVTESEMTIALGASGAIGAMHRFMTIEENINQYKKVTSAGQECFLSLGVNRDWKERAKELYSVGARYFIIDIAHGHSLMMKNTVEWLRSEFGKNVFLVGGNVTTAQSVKDLTSWSVDGIKIGVGPGAVCLTKNVTGVTMPIFSAICECAKVSKLPLIADGGCKEIGDVCKAIGAGATMVMSGFFFSGTEETPSKTRYYDEQGQEKFAYRGMASADVMATFRTENLPIPEGKVIEVKSKGSVKHIVEHIAGGLRSSYSYVGAKNTQEFQENVVFGIRRR